MKKEKAMNVMFLTKDVFKVTYPGGDFATYCKDIQMPLSDIDILFGKGDDLESIRRVIVDEKLFEWLEINNLQNTAKNRFEYVNNIPDREAKLLWDNSPFSKEERLDYIVTLISSGDSELKENYALRLDTVEVISRHISNMCQIDADSISLSSRLHSLDLIDNSTASKWCLANNDEASSMGIRVLPIYTKCYKQFKVSRNDAITHAETSESYLNIEGITKDIEEAILKDLGLRKGIKGVLCYPRALNFSKADDLHSLMIDIFASI